jgi:hypothetical protein
LNQILLADGTSGPACFHPEDRKKHVGRVSRSRACVRDPEAWHCGRQMDRERACVWPLTRSSCPPPRAARHVRQARAPPARRGSDQSPSPHSPCPFRAPAGTGSSSMGSRPPHVLPHQPLAGETTSTDRRTSAVGYVTRSGILSFFASLARCG